MSETEARLTSIEQRLTMLELYIRKSHASPAEEPRHEIPKHAQIQPPPLPELSISIRPPLQEVKSGNWLGVIAVICFVLAAAFIIKLSIESGWLTPQRQIGLAILFGFGLIGAGFALMNSDREYASLLPGAGIIVLYITFFSTHRLYSLISFETALASSAAVSGLSVWLYTRIKHDVYPITAAVGAYIAPVVLGLSVINTFAMYYFILCSLGFAVISIWVQSRILTMISAYLAILISAFIGLDLKQDDLVSFMLFLHFLIFATGTFFYTKKFKRPLTENESWSLFPVLLVFYAMEYYYLNRIQPSWAPWISLGFAGILLGLYLSAKKLFPDRNLASQSLILAFVTVVCFHSLYLELIPKDYHPWLFALVVSGGAFLPIRLWEKKNNDALVIPTLALFAILAIELYSMIIHLISGSETSWLIVSMVSLASLWVVLIFQGTQLKVQKIHDYILLGPAHVLAILAFYRLTTDYGSLAVSASWLIYAICVIAFAFARKDVVMAKSAIFVLGLAAGKALLYDASSAPTVVRILCLLLTGAVLYGAGFLIRKISSWAT
ncbi:MAG: hypothetical protein A2X86_06110 [Bdellovibrionales bacterium GWA2_49_15]|nr:MAG: hypothetical protein A2X86_06110 [Bdellovibrionales bacterium GWA2_49_15]HAZ14636.1 DUF2339 domain-containing protein [Bdellovibrionales bacterium]